MGESSQFKRLAGGIGGAWLREATDSPSEEQSAKDGLIDILYTYRYVVLISQTMHWFMSGATSSQDHALMKMVYEKFNEMMDALGERLAGTMELEPTDMAPAEQAAVVAQWASDFQELDASFHEGSKASKLLLEELAGAIASIEAVDSSDEITLGTSNMLQGHADEIDKLMYHLDRRARS